jgi:sensor histidine kinase YesM
MTRKTTRILLYNAQVLFICALIGVVTSALFARRLNLEISLGNALYGMLVGYPLWMGNAYAGVFVRRWFPWNRNPVKTLWLSLLLGFVITIFIIVVVNFVFYNYYSDEFISLTRLFDVGFSAMISEIIITIIVTNIMYFSKFFNEWRQIAVEHEKMKQLALSHQFEALKNQVNPHFLFNSLNVLTSLVETNQEQAVKFIRQMSEVYRYVLENKDKELVEVETEMKFAASYIFLLKIRFDQSLIVDVSLSGSDYYIIPLAMQLLLENAVKHNIISLAQPLHIAIFEDDQYVVVKNNLQVKSVMPGSGIGLNNIRERYSRLTRLPVIVENKDAAFIVKIPKIYGNP